MLVGLTWGYSGVLNLIAICYMAISIASYVWGCVLRKRSGNANLRSDQYKLFQLLISPAQAQEETGEGRRLRMIIAAELLLFSKILCFPLEIYYSTKSNAQRKARSGEKVGETSLAVVAENLLRGKQVHGSVLALAFTVFASIFSMLQYSTSAGLWAGIALAIVLVPLLSTLFSIRPLALAFKRQLGNPFAHYCLCFALSIFVVAMNIGILRGSAFGADTGEFLPGVFLEQLLHASLQAVPDMLNNAADWLNAGALVIVSLALVSALKSLGAFTRDSDDHFFFAQNLTSLRRQGEALKQLEAVSSEAVGYCGNMGMTLIAKGDIVEGMKLLEKEMASRGVTANSSMVALILGITYNLPSRINVELFKNLTSSPSADPASAFIIIATPTFFSEADYSAQSFKDLLVSLPTSHYLYSLATGSLEDAAKELAVITATDPFHACFSDIHNFLLSTSKKSFSGEVDVGQINTWLDFYLSKMKQLIPSLDPIEALLISDSLFQIFEFLDSYAIKRRPEVQELIDQAMEVYQLKSPHKK